MILRVMSYNKHDNTFLCVEKGTDEPLYNVNLTMGYSRENCPQPNKFIGSFVKIDELKPILFIGTNALIIRDKQIGMSCS